MNTQTEEQNIPANIVMESCVPAKVSFVYTNVNRRFIVGLLLCSLNAYVLRPALYFFDAYV
jgi:hypothetical protein